MLSKPVEEGEAPAGEREGLGRPVGQRVQLVAGVLELGEERHGAIDLARDHLAPAREVRLDHRALVGMARRRLLDRRGEAAPAILLLVPGGMADLGEKPLHGGLVVEQLAVEVARIPVDQHATQIVHDDRPFPAARLHHDHLALCPTERGQLAQEIGGGNPVPGATPGASTLPRVVKQL